MLDRGTRPCHGRAACLHRFHSDDQVRAMDLSYGRLCTAITTEERQKKDQERKACEYIYRYRLSGKIKTSQVSRLDKD